MSLSKMSFKLRQKNIKLYNLNSFLILCPYIMVPFIITLNSVICLHSFYVKNLHPMCKPSHQKTPVSFLPYTNQCFKCNSWFPLWKKKFWYNKGFYSKREF